jgi:HAD superfamily hydrolase (TIGR01490 family)
MVLAIFDFDGTITHKDSFRLFLQYAVKGSVYFRGLIFLSPVLIAYFLGVVPNHVAKQKVFAHFFGGWRAEDFAVLADKYSSSEVGQIIRPEAIKRIAWHQRQGHKVVVVSASIKNWLDYWCRIQGVDLIATEVEEKDELLTGRFRTPNCNGSEKVRRLKDRFDFTDIDYIYAYGNSSGDKDILELANEKFYRFF